MVKDEGLNYERFFNRKWATSISILTTVGLIIGGLINPAAAAHSVVSNDGFFEDGSLDAELRMAVTPVNSVSVSRVMCYKGSIENQNSPFYELNMNTQSNKQRGERGQRTQHVIKETSSELIIILFIQNPTDEDQGDYFCLLYIKHTAKPVVAKMKLSKRVALLRFTGQNTSFAKGAHKTNLKIKMFPGNANFNWIRCFRNSTSFPKDHFYTYDHRTGKIMGKGDLGRRTGHWIAVKENVIVFSLRITNPTQDDTGPICCQIDATGHIHPVKIVAWINMEDRVHTTGQKESVAPTLGQLIAGRTFPWFEAITFITFVCFCLLRSFLIIKRKCNRS